MGIETILIILTIVFGSYMAWNIGANDVANAMGTSVGSKALTFKKAILIAAIFEFAGAFFLGTQVTNTIRKDIVLIDKMVALGLTPTILIQGMLAALIGSAIWIHIATFFGLPVSTSHSIVGGVLGFGLIFGGAGVVNWGKLGAIASSWILSPVVGALLGAAIFVLIRNKILDTKTPIKNFIKIAPYLLFFASFILCMSAFFKSFKNVNLELSPIQITLIAITISLLVSLIGTNLLKKVIFKKIKNRDMLDRGDEYGRQYQIIEDTFKYFQMVTASFMAFAHGSNDVANATGPVAAIVSSIGKTVLGKDTANPVSMWVLGIGAAGIVVGLFTYGYKVIRTIGQKITALTPTRGFSAELGATITIILGSNLGMPISTTHTVVGAIVGIGMARGIAAINKNMLKNIFSSWVITLPAAGIATIIAFKILGSIF